ncbi:MAG TPA: hypothetical protein VF941_03345 [Clostridia bacterium]
MILDSVENFLASIYAILIGMNYDGMVYNKDAFKEEGINQMIKDMAHGKIAMTFLVHGLSQSL